MELYAYCFMPNHVHLIFRSNNDNPDGLLQDFKSFTTKKMIEVIETNPQESRKEYLLWFLNVLQKRNLMILNINFGNTIISLLSYGLKQL